MARHAGGPRPVRRHPHQRVRQVHHQGPSSQPGDRAPRGSRGKPLGGYRRGRARPPSQPRMDGPERPRSAQPAGAHARGRRSRHGVGRHRRRARPPAFGTSPPRCRLGSPTPRQDLRPSRGEGPTPGRGQGRPALHESLDLEGRRAARVASRARQESVAGPGRHPLGGDARRPLRAQAGADGARTGAPFLQGADGDVDSARPQRWPVGGNRDGGARAGVGILGRDPRQEPGALERPGLEPARRPRGQPLGGHPGRRRQSAQRREVQVVLHGRGPGRRHRLARAGGSRREPVDRHQEREASRASATASSRPTRPPRVSRATRFSPSPRMRTGRSGSAPGTPA